MKSFHDSVSRGFYHFTELFFSVRWKSYVELNRMFVYYWQVRVRPWQHCCACIWQKHLSCILCFSFYIHCIFQSSNELNSNVNRNSTYIFPSLQNKKISCKVFAFRKEGLGKLLFSSGDFLLFYSTLAFSTFLVFASIHSTFDRSEL